MGHGARGMRMGHPDLHDDEELVSVLVGEALEPRRVLHRRLGVVDDRGASHDHEPISRAVNQPGDVAAPGFTCPGTTSDTLNDPPGSLPIQLEVGARSVMRPIVRQVPQLTATLLLEEDADLFDEAAPKERLSITLGIPANLITLDASAGSVIVVLHLTPLSASVFEQLNRTLASLDDAQLSSSLGINATRLAPIVTSSANVSVMSAVQTPCSKGFWCTAGYAIPCEKGRYNPSNDADNANACRACPRASTTMDRNSTSIHQCLCEPGDRKSVV